MVIGGHFGGGDHFDGGHRFGGGTVARIWVVYPKCGLTRPGKGFLLLQF